MNEKIDLTKILKDCPKGTKLYSTIYGDVKFELIDEHKPHPIITRVGDDLKVCFTADGKMYSFYDGECILFPSREQRDWSEFKPKKPKQPKFDPKTLQPFDKVLTKSLAYGVWQCDFFSNINDNNCYTPYNCISNVYKQCIPYNDDTKHLVGTTKEAPEYYRYWED